MKNHFIYKASFVLMMLLSFTSIAVAQNATERIILAKNALKAYIAYNGNDEKKEQVIALNKELSESQKDEFLAYIIDAITDSLNVYNRPSAMHYIDCYKSIAAPNDELLGSLIMIQGKYYSDKMYADKLQDLILYVKELIEKSSLDYSTELSYLEKMKNEVEDGCDKMLGYWVVDDESAYPPFFIKIDKENGQYVVHTKNREHFNFWLYCNLEIEPQRGTLGMLIINSINTHFIFPDSQTSSECVMNKTNSLSYYWASEDLKIGKEQLASSLRMGVRNISNRIVGELARSNSHKTNTSIYGTAASYGAEILINMFIDWVAKTRKKIQTINGVLTMQDNNTLSATIYANYYGIEADSPNVKQDSIQFSVKMIRYNLTDENIAKNIVFIEDNKLRTFDYLSKEQTETFYSTHPEVKKAKKSYKKTAIYNRGLLEKLKEYNRIQDNNNKE